MGRYVSHPVKPNEEWYGYGKSVWIVRPDPENKDQGTIHINKIQFDKSEIGKLFMFRMEEVTFDEFNELDKKIIQRMRLEFMSEKEKR